MVSKTLIAVHTKDIMIEMIQTPQSIEESAVKLFQVLISISYLATFKPQLMPNAIPSNKNETK